ncbi:MAG TPA: aldo/keto reductase [Cyclobacteriaceae bacterium]|nr:aldo/keto reductase [Cyclobacteriaceae bacterium]
MEKSITGDNLIRLGGTDLLVSRIGIGAMTWGDLSISPRFNPARIAYGPADKKEELLKAVETSLSKGVNFLDTAAMYGKGASELIVGELSQGKKICIATKFPSSFFPKTSDFPNDLGNSLTRLKRSAIDLYQIHYPSPWLSIPKVLIHMAKAFHEGKIKAVGVSNFSEKQMRLSHKILADEGVPLASNQVEYSLLHRDPEKNGVLDTCRELNITLIAYMPLRMGALTGKYTGDVRPKGFRKYMSPFRKKDLKALFKVIDRMKEIGNRNSVSASQVALRWLIQQDHVLPIPGAKNSRQALDNASAMTFSLSNSEIDELDKMTLNRN